MLTYYFLTNLNTKNTGFILLFITLTFLFIPSCETSNSSNLNLDFEKIDSQSKKASEWNYFENGFKVSPDNEIVNCGKYSLRIEPTSEPTPYSHVGGATLKFDNIKPNQKIRLTGFIKNENTICDSIGLSIWIFDAQGFSRKALKSRNFIGTHNWLEYSVEITAKDNPEYFIIGFSMEGPGKIWVDNLKLFIDEKQVITRPVSSNFKANKNEIKWLKNHSIQIKTVHYGNGFQDLQPLKESLKNAKIIALGENTHGTSEIFEMKHRLIEFLCSEMNFNIFAIESNLPNAYLINDYVLKGIGDPKKLLSNNTPALNTQEVLDMVTWIRDFNKSGKGKIQFTGFDMQQFNLSLKYVNDFAKNNDYYDLMLKIDSTSIKLKSLQLNLYNQKIKNQFPLKECNQILTYLLNLENQTSTPVNKADLSWAIQNANIVRQYCDYYSNGKLSATRDKYMAENVSWILESNPDSKVILWAHNAHVWKQNDAMGSFLSNKYGDQYFAIGFLTNEGNYTAGKQNTISTQNKLIKGEPGSYEYNFNKTRLSYLFFDFDKVDMNNPDSRWLSSKLNHREIGAEATEDQFYPIVLKDKFDAIIFINSTTPSKTLIPIKKTN